MKACMTFCEVLDFSTFLNMLKVSTAATGARSYACALWKFRNQRTLGSNSRVWRKLHSAI